MPFKMTDRFKSAIHFLKQGDPMRKIISWFTPERRQLVQAFLAALAVLAVQFGLGTEGQWEQIIILAGAALGAAAGLLSLVNVRLADWSTQGWAIVRGVIYALATVASPALVALGVYNDQVNTLILTGVAQAITVLSAAIAIFANGQQQAAAKFIAGVSLRRNLKG